MFAACRSGSHQRTAKASTEPVKTAGAAKIPSEPVWEKAHPDVELKFRRGAALPLRYTIYRIDTQQLGDWLRQVPKLDEQEKSQKAGTITLPAPDDQTITFKLFNQPVMAPELAAKFPEIMTFRGQAENQPATSVQCEFTPRGFTAQILSTQETYLIEPLENQGLNLYIVFRKGDLPPVKNKEFPEGNPR
jgi:hypothetical protein